MQRLIVAALLLAASAGCAARGRTIGPGAASIPPGSFESEGTASWYGDPYHGRRTASGEIFDKNAMTAAHRTLPFETWVRVENELNGRSVEVRINDRGPFVAGRIIDLSEEAARRIDMVRSGVAPVRLTVLRTPEVREDARTREASSDTFYVVQLGAFENPDRAEALRSRLASRYTGIYVERPNDDGLYRVRIGRALLREAQELQRVLRERDDLDAIVVPVF